MVFHGDFYAPLFRDCARSSKLAKRRHYRGFIKSEERDKTRDELLLLNYL